MEKDALVIGYFAGHTSISYYNVWYLTEMEILKQKERYKNGTEILYLRALRKYRCDG